MPTTNTPNMGLILPVPGEEPGPDYAGDNNASFSIIDGHNHAPGSGVQINPAGLNINTDLAFGNNNATLLRSSRYVNAAAPLAVATDLGCVYVSGGNLYYNNSGGTAVQITSGSSVNAGAGSITGLPSGTASVTFNAATYVFQSATSTPATVDVGSVILRNTTASSNGITLSPPNSLGSNYSITLPAIPGQTNIMSLDNSGNMAAAINVDNSTLQLSSNILSVKNSGIGTSQIASQAITQGLIAIRASGSSVSAGGIAISASSGGFTTTSTSEVSVTNLSVTIVTLGNPVRVELQTDGTSSGSALGALTGTNPSGAGYQLYRGSTGLGPLSIEVNATGVSTVFSPPGSISMTDIVGAGTYTYTLKMKAFTGATALCYFCKLVAYELK